MKLFTYVLIAVVVLGLGGVNASAASINLATGLNASGTVQLVGGSVDANWIYNDSYVSPTTGNAEVVDSTDADWYGGWLPNGLDSSWIAPDPFIADNGPAPYTFTRTFDLTGYDLSSVALSGLWTIDDEGTLALNGTTIATLGDGNWGSLNAFTVAGTGAVFNQGLNTLTITMTYDDQYLEAVRLQGLVTGNQTTIPEPATWVLFGLGAAAVGVLRRRTA
jgi:hypothetical protein